MKLHKLFFLGIFLLLFSSAVIAYTPEDPGVVEGLLFIEDEDGEIQLGQETRLRLLVKNSLNDTISNITIFQEIPENTEFLTIMGNNFNDSYYENDTTTTDIITNSPLNINYLNVTSSNFTVNFDHSMQRGEKFAFDFSINVTIDGAYDFLAPDITYYDHWGDMYTAQSTIAFSITVFTVAESPIDKYLPDFTTSPTNYQIVVGSVLLIFVVALIGRVLYLKKPFVL